MPHTVTPSQAEELAVVERSGFIESRHIGIAVVLNADGEVVAQHGDAAGLILPRSSLKPLQALACATAGASLEGAELALSTASHSGTDRHAATVRSILERARLTEDALGCPPAWPGDSGARDALVREHSPKARIRMNCSGKHAAMLLACVANGWAVETYLDPGHPLQVHIREIVERMAGEKAAVTAIDGCGAPVYALSLLGLARAIHRVGASSETSPFALHRSAGALVRAVKENPWAIEGPGRPDTIVVERTGLFAKHGAEGVMVMAAPNGTTAAVKVLDGSGRAAAAVALRLLAAAGALPTAQVQDVLGALPLTLSGGSSDVGIIRATVG